jgi:ComF family protein
VSGEKLPDDNSNDFLDDRIISSLDRLTVNDITEMKVNTSNKDIFSIFSFKTNSDMQKIIHHFKYNGFTKIGNLFGSVMADELLKSNLNISEFDIITAVPLFASKERSRGYNQSAVLAEAINRKLELLYIPDLLKRIKDTKSQTYMKKEDRIANVKNVFRIDDKYEIKGKKVILIDDVMTTGSTISECIKVLKKKGCEKVLAASIAIAK